MFAKKTGFTLVEIILVVAIVSVLSVIAISSYRSLIKNTEVDLTANNLIFDLKQAKANALSGVDNRRWGVRLVNSPTGIDYYELFSTPTNFSDPATVIESTDYFPATIYFTDPSDIAGTKEIVFEKIKGTLSGTQTIDISSVDNFSRLIEINQLGNIR